MTSLKQIFEENTEHLRSEKKSGYDWEIEIQSVREWLQQKRENVKDRYASGEAYFYDELLEELKQQ